MLSQISKIIILTPANPVWAEEQEYSQNRERQTSDIYENLIYRYIKINFPCLIIIFFC